MTEAGVEKKNTFPVSFEELTQAGVKLKRSDLANKLEPFIFEAEGQRYKIIHIKKDDKRSSQFGGQDTLVVFNSKNEFVGAVTGVRYVKWFDNKLPKDDGKNSFFIEAKQIVDSTGKHYDFVSKNKDIALNIDSSFKSYEIREDYSQQMSGFITQINSQNIVNSQNIAKNKQNLANLLNNTPLAKNIKLPVADINKGNSAQFCQSCHAIPKQSQASAKRAVGSLN